MGHQTRQIATQVRAVVISDLALRRSGHTQLFQVFGMVHHFSVQFDTHFGIPFTQRINQGRAVGHHSLGSAVLDMAGKLLGLLLRQVPQAQVVQRPAIRALGQRGKVHPFCHEQELHGLGDLRRFGAGCIVSNIEHLSLAAGAGSSGMP